MKLGPKRTKNQILLLKKNILKGMMALDTDKEIMEKYKIPETTFYKYVKDVVADMMKEHLSDSNRIVSEYVGRSKGRAKRLDREGLTKDAGMIEKDLFDRVQSVGMIPKVREKLDVATDITVTWVKEIKKKEDK